MQQAKLVSLIICLTTSPYSTVASAACPDGNKVVFSCITTNEKSVDVCDTGKTITYKFGKPGSKPELVLSVPRSLASTYQWQGIGRAIHYNVTIPNGNTFYTVFHSIDTRDDRKVSAGIIVSIGSELNTVSTLACKNDAIEENLEGIDLRVVQY